ncbi:MAG TPA: YicC family protein [Rhodobacteraceae bacterium]|nr:YicC family protein [Paracoccaceae bacterium]
MITSMTGFAARNGESDGFSWAWEVRSVNAKGLDIRLRVPDWVEGLEAAVRKQLAKSVGRGNINLTLRVQRDEGSAPLNLNDAQLARVLDALSRIEDAAADSDLTLVHCTAADVLAQRGVIDTSVVQDDTGPLLAALLEDLPPLLEDFTAMRRTEGAALDKVIHEQINQIEVLTKQATIAAEARREDVAQTLRENLARVLDNTDGADADRVAQELALLAVKSDVMEELDRLRAHVDAARDLMGKSGPIGRKLDFLMQEFMREANTLCSKSQSVDLTRIGLDLKAVIDQMREQVQNVE